MTCPLGIQASMLVAGCLLSTPGFAQSSQKPQVLIVATGGTIAGVQKSAEQHGYTAGELGVSALVEAVPQLKDLAAFGVSRW
jgi:L-asparaginase